MTSRGEELPKNLTPEEFARFRDYIDGHSGICLEESKRDSLRISLVARATRLGLTGFDEYFRVVTSDEHEFKELLNLITINETSFFRFPAQFDALRDHVLPEIMRGRPPGENVFRVWSAGCSTGEEPYSLAMTLRDSGMEGLGWRPQVVGTDVSTAAVATARRAVYPAKALLGVPDEVVARHFERTGDAYRVRRHTRSIVEFAYHNLVQEPYPLAVLGSWDVVFCRNVTIYFNIESTRRVVSSFFRMLNPGGYLFVGHSETLTNISQEFEPVEVGGVFLYRKPPAAQFSIPVPEVRPMRARPSRGPAEETRARRRQPAAPHRPADAPARPAPPPAASPGEAAPLIEEARRLAAAGEPREVLAIVSRLRGTGAAAVEAHLLAAYAHADLGDYDEALAACNDALAVDPLLPTARYILGIIHQRKGDVAGAMSELRKTIYIDADFVLAHLNLGNLYKAQRDFDRASRSYENALRALYANPEGEWSTFLGGFKADLLVKTIERSLLECRKAAGSG